MTCGPVLDDDRIARHCRKDDIRRDGGPKPQAFQFRENEADLSVNWIEYFLRRGLSFAEAMQRIRDDDGTPTPRRSHRYAIVPVEKLILAVQFALARTQQEVGRPVLTHTPAVNNESHVSIVGDEFEFDTPEIRTDIAQLLFESDMEPGLSD